MPSVKHPGKPPGVHCEQCRKEVPESAAMVPESKDRVMYFCGLECYEMWKENPSGVGEASGVDRQS